MIYACRHHDEVLAHWRRRDLRNVALAHVDFHDDLRGLLVDRRRAVAYPIGRLARGLTSVDPGNFLAHAVLEERLRAVRWIHGPVGGRAWDAGIVRYESDLFAWHHRLRHRLAGGAEYALSFEEMLLDAWNGPRPDELLSVDWDCFASTLIEPGDLEQRVEQFVDRLGTVVPADTWVAYSPDYCHPTVEAFLQFVTRLGERFAQPVEWLDDGLGAGRIPPCREQAALPRDPLTRLALFLRRRGIY